MDNKYNIIMYKHNDNKFNNIINNIKIQNVRLQNIENNLNNKHNKINNNISDIVDKIKCDIYKIKLKYNDGLK